MHTHFYEYTHATLLLIMSLIDIEIDIAHYVDIEIDECH